MLMFLFHYSVLDSGRTLFHKLQLDLQVNGSESASVVENVAQVFAFTYHLKSLVIAASKFGFR